MGDTTETTLTPTEQAQANFETILAKTDTSVFMAMFVTVIGATIGISLGMTALKKGVNWLKGALKKA